MPGACDRRATQRGGMHRRPERLSYFLTGPKAIAVSFRSERRTRFARATAHRTLYFAAGTVVHSARRDLRVPTGGAPGRRGAA